MFNFRTDMADERNRILRKENNLETVPGIETESIEEENNIKTNKVKVISNEGEKAIGKPIGTYITIDFKNLKIADENDIQKASEVVTKELKKPTAQWCLEDFISDACASEDDADAYKIQNIKFIRALVKPNGQLMAYLLLLKLRSAEIPITIFLTNESIPYNIDMMLRKEYPYYYYNSMVPYHGGYTIE